MKRRSIKYIGLVLLCVAGCMFVAACGQDKGSAVRNDEGSVLSGETEAKDVEKSTDPADYEIGTRDHIILPYGRRRRACLMWQQKVRNAWKLTRLH